MDLEHLPTFFRSMMFDTERALFRKNRCSAHVATVILYSALQARGPRANIFLWPYMTLMRQEEESVTIVIRVIQQNAVEVLPMPAMVPTVIVQTVMEP